MSNISNVGFLKAIYDSRKDKEIDLTVVCRQGELSQEEFESIAVLGRPCVFQVRRDGTSVVSPYELLQRLGDRDVEIRFGNFHKPNEYSTSRQVRRQPLKEYIRSLSGRGAVKDVGYLGNYRLTVDDVLKIGEFIPPFHSLDAFQLPSMWLGKKDCVTPLHVDGIDNFAFHLFGAKRWTLIPVQAYPDLGVSVPFPEKAPNLHTSSLDLTLGKVRADLKRRGIPIIEVTVKAGEVLYLPAGWFHFVETLETSLMINWWIDKDKALPAALTAA